MEKKRKTFLSYSRVNKDFALKLANELKAEGFSVWLDVLDIPVGARWDVEVERALTESEIFLVIVTHASSTSENVLDEIGYAIDHSKRILPVLLEKTNIPLRLRRFQYVDFTNKSFDEGVQLAKELLRNLISLPTVPRNNIVEKTPDNAARQDSPALTTTGALRREKVEQEMRFREEETRLRQEKAVLEKQLLEERTTQERIRGITAKSRRGYAIFGVALLVLIASVGLLITRSSPGMFGGAEQPTAEPTLRATDALIPITSDDTPTSTATQESPPTATDAPATMTPTDAITATPGSELTDEKGIEMVRVPEGEFQMGSSKGEADEKPVHPVYLASFYIDKFEVTNSAYRSCVEDSACEPPNHSFFFPESPNRAYYGNPDYDNYPVIYVDWRMAKTYCEWRGARLPTEAEWEKAARGPSGNTYSWGSGLDCQKANYQKCVNRTSEVGSYVDGVSPYGAYDMTGNVWEWVADWYSDSYYSTSPRNNPAGPITGQSRVLRGGSWPRYDVTTFHRSNFAPDYNTFDIGFRCALSAAQ